MNKYYIAWPLPSEFVAPMLRAQDMCRKNLLLPSTKLTPQDEFHITAAYLGKMPREQAEDLMMIVHGYKAYPASLTKVDVFKQKRGPNALVVLVEDTYLHMRATHEAFIRAAGLKSTFPFNPHVTLAKTDTSPDFGMHSAADLLNEHYKLEGAQLELDQIVLFEKAEGDVKYEPRRVINLQRIYA